MFHLLNNCFNGLEPPSSEGVESCFIEVAPLLFFCYPSLPRHHRCHSQLLQALATSHRFFPCQNHPLALHLRRADLHRRYPWYLPVAGSHTFQDTWHVLLLGPSSRSPLPSFSFFCLASLLDVAVKPSISQIVR